jgi:hypothetical protein
VRGRGCAFDGSSALDVGDTLDFAGKQPFTLELGCARRASPTGGFDNTLDLPDTPQHLRFGRYFDGVLDEIALYDKALPEDRIGEHFRAGR